MNRLFVVTAALTMVGCTVAPLPTDTGESASSVAHAPEEQPQVERQLPSGTLEIGDETAPHTLIVFTEHHCNYCKEFMEEHFERLQHDYIEPGFLNLQIIPFTLKKYLGSEHAARGLLCATAQGEGLPMHRLLHTRKHSFTEELVLYAQELALDAHAFTECIESDNTHVLLEEQKLFAEREGISLVPSFILDDETKTGLLYWPDLKGWIDATLRR